MGSAKEQISTIKMKLTIIVALCLVAGAIAKPTKKDDDKPPKPVMDLIGFCMKMVEEVEAETEDKRDFEAVFEQLFPQCLALVEAVKAEMEEADGDSARSIGGSRKGSRKGSGMNSTPGYDMSPEEPDSMRSYDITPTGEPESMRSMGGSRKGGRKGSQNGSRNGSRKGSQKGSRKGSSMDVNSTPGYDMSTGEPESLRSMGSGSKDFAIEDAAKEFLEICKGLAEMAEKMVEEREVLSEDEFMAIMMGVQSACDAAKAEAESMRPTGQSDKRRG